MIEFDVEPPDGTTCLDYLRMFVMTLILCLDVLSRCEFSSQCTNAGYHFTASGSPVETDACGELDDLSSGLKSGVHGHKLTLDFRSNRIHRATNFFLSMSCIAPQQPIGKRKRRQVTDTQQTAEVIAPEYECTASKSLTNEIVRDPYKEPTREDFLVR